MEDNRGEKSMNLGKIFQTFCGTTHTIDKKFSTIEACVACNADLSWDERYIKSACLQCGATARYSSELGITTSGKWVYEYYFTFWGLIRIKKDTYFLTRQKIEEREEKAKDSIENLILRGF